VSLVAGEVLAGLDAVVWFGLAAHRSVVQAFGWLVVESQPRREDRAEFVRSSSEAAERE
jgi:hypothetical protein